MPGIASRPSLSLLHIGRYGVSRRMATDLALRDQADGACSLVAARLATKRSPNTWAAYLRESPVGHLVRGCSRRSGPAKANDGDGRRVAQGTVRRHQGRNWLKSLAVRVQGEATAVRSVAANCGSSQGQGCGSARSASAVQRDPCRVGTGARVAAHGVAAELARGCARASPPRRGVAPGLAPFCRTCPADSHP
jgi:hypothetical protein